MKKLFVLLFLMASCFVGCAEAQTATTDGDNYKLYETTNLWTFLKLDTRTGKIWQVQYSVKGPEYRFESVLNAEDLSYGNTKPGKYELYKASRFSHALRPETSASVRYLVLLSAIMYLLLVLDAGGFDVDEF